MRHVEIAPHFTESVARRFIGGSLHGQRFAIRDAKYHHVVIGQQALVSYSCDKCPEDIQTGTEEIYERRTLSFGPERKVVIMVRSTFDFQDQMESLADFIDGS